jgi:prepilin-type N-terminal cleavage/methylation domain-containing protein
MISRNNTAVHFGSVQRLAAFTPLEKAADFNRRSTPFKADGGLKPPSAQTVRERSSLTGFTMIEIMLVVLILSILAGLTLPHFSRTYKNFELTKETQDLAYAMRYAQSRAVTKGKEMRLEFSPDFSSYQLAEEVEGDLPQEAERSFKAIHGRWGRVFQLPAPIKIESEEMYVHFYADGSMDKRHVFICRDEPCLTISTKEQRGHVRIFEGGIR